MDALKFFSCTVVTHHSLYSSIQCVSMHLCWSCPPQADQKKTPSPSSNSPFLHLHYCRLVVIFCINSPSVSYRSILLNLENWNAGDVSCSGAGGAPNLIMCTYSSSPGLLSGDLLHCTGGWWRDITTNGCVSFVTSSWMWILQITQGGRLLLLLLVKWNGKCARHLPPR